jgi:hypothetical protein
MVLRETKISPLSNVTSHPRKKVAKFIAVFGKVNVRMECAMWALWY